MDAIGVYVYGTRLKVSGAGEQDANGTYATGVSNIEFGGVQWLPLSGLDYDIHKDGTRWYINTPEGTYAATSDTQWPWECEYTTDGTQSPAPTVTRIVEPLQDILDALQF